MAFWKKLLVADGDALSEMAVAGRSTPERLLLQREELRAVWDAVATLSLKQRAVFLLRFVEEMSLEEISQAAGMKLATVKTHLFRAVGAVRKKIRGQS